MPTRVEGRGAARQQAGAHLPPGKADQGPPAPGSRRQIHRPDDYPAELSAYTLRAPEQIKRSVASQGPAVAAYAECLFDGPLPWAKLRQGHKLIRLGVKGGGILGHGVSTVSENVRLSGQRKCHSFCSR